ncbi:MAG TPA: hypothetical protein VMS75_09785 [Terriglobales bacterium]|nr:hypothetical protein [Terriglobales bacterium]
MRYTRALGALLALSCLAAAVPLGADVKAELGFGWSLAAPAFSTAYQNRFTPPMTPSANALSSSASQTVRLKGKIASGMSGFFNVLINDRFGVQVLVDYFRPGLGGTNSTYDVSLTYYLTDPADQYSYAKQTAWPSSRGDFTETTYSLNGLVRFPVGPDLALSVSGGPSLYSLKGQAMPMGFTSFRLDQTSGGYLLDIKTYQLVYELPARTTAGFNLGGELSYTVMRMMVLALDVRYFLSARTDFRMNVTPNEGLTDPIEPIAAALNLGTIRVDPSYLRLGLILRFRF